MAMKRIGELEDALAEKVTALTAEAREVRGDSIPLGSWDRFEDDWHVPDDYQGLVRTAVFRSGDQERRVRAICGVTKDKEVLRRLDNAIRSQRILRGAKDEIHVSHGSLLFRGMGTPLTLEARGPAIKFTPNPTSPGTTQKEATEKVLRLYGKKKD